MKNISLVIILFWASHKANAQYSVAGSTVGIYTNVIPDTLVLGAYYVDINQDGNNDIRISSSLTGTLEGSGYHAETKYTSATSLNSSLVGLCSWKTFCAGNLLMPINTGDTISNDDYINSGYTSYYYHSFFNPSCGNTEWMDSLEHYIGVRYATNIDTAYGWIRVKVTTRSDQFNSNYHVVIVKDFCLEKNPLVGLHELIANSVHVTTSPNPVQTQLHIEADDAEISEIKIVSMTGMELINTRQYDLDMSTLPNGIYFAEIKTDKGVGTRKVVVQR